MSARSIVVVTGGALVVLAALAWAVNSKQVVDFLFQLNDPETEPVYSPAEGPIEFDQAIADWVEVALPDQVEQPSGVEILEGSLILSTDKAEFLVFDSDGRLQSSAMLRQLPLLFRQGFSEGVACASLLKCYVVAGDTLLLELRWEGDAWRSREVASLAHHVPAGLELQALAMNRATQLIYTAAIRDETITVWVVDPRAPSVREQQVGIRRLAVKHDRHLAELEVVGMGYEDQTLYALTSPANLLLAIDTERWSVRRVIGLEGLGDSQGMSVRDGAINVVTDHEYHEPLPPLRRAELP